MNISRIGGYKIAAAAVSTAALLAITGCHGKTQNTNTVEQAENQKYVNVKLTSNDNPGTDLRIENGISIKFDNKEYYTKDGKLITTKYSEKEGSLQTRDNDILELSNHSAETLKMIAAYNNEEDSNDTLTLSKQDIKSAQNRAFDGYLWDDAKKIMPSEYKIGIIKNIGNNGMDITLQSQPESQSKLKLSYEI